MLISSLADNFWEFLTFVDDFFLGTRIFHWHIFRLEAFNKWTTKDGQLGVPTGCSRYFWSDGGEAN